MALDPRKRQKKLEQRRAKEKAKSKTLAVRQSHYLAARFERASSGAIMHCLTSASLWDQGIGSVLMSREVGPDRVAHALFLVDMYCLGVKDVFFDIFSQARYEKDVYHKLLSRSKCEACAPEFARKLIADVVAYARAIGLEPHPDYERASAIFGDIDASLCREEFDFGRDGKPFFISGPNDTPDRCARIVNILQDRCGPGGFDFLLHMTQSSMMAAGLSRLNLP